MRKITVAVVCTEQHNGYRIYKAFDRLGREHFGIKVADCGHGAAIAHETISKRYNISFADWAMKMAQETQPLVY